MRFQKGDKEINALLDSLTEIIKQSKSGAELRERYYKAIIDRVNAGIIAIDSNGNVRICNDNALKMLGMKYAANTAAINRSLPGFDNIIADSPVAGTTIVGLGKDKNLSVSVSGFVHDGNTTTVCVLTDIHNALSRKEVDAWINLTRVLTHEIMNSIAPINALSDSLLPTASGTMKEKIEVIRDTSASLMAFTETFRKFSAIPKPQRQLVYVADLISEATTLLSESIANASVKIHTENDLIVNADRTLMVRALVNLLHNAVDAGATKIDICSRSCSDDSVVIDISDNGSPIPEECRDRIFVPFSPRSRTDRASDLPWLGVCCRSTTAASLSFSQPTLHTPRRSECRSYNFPLLGKNYAKIFHLASWFPPHKVQPDLCLSLSAFLELL